MGDVAIDLTAAEGVAGARLDASRLRCTPLEHLTAVLPERSQFLRHARQLRAEEACAGGGVLADALIAAVQAFVAQTPSKKMAKKRKTSPFMFRGFVQGTGFGGTAGLDKSLSQKLAAAAQRERKADASMVPLLEAVTKALRERINSKEHCCPALGLLVDSSPAEILRVRSETEENSNTTKSRKRGRGRKAANGAAVEDITFVTLVRSYLRNDSVMDICERLPLYEKLLEVIEVVASSPSYTGLASALFSEPTEKDNNDGKDDLEDLESDEAEPNLVLKKGEKPHMYSAILKMHAQGNLYLSNAKSVEQAPELASSIDFFAKLVKTVKTMQEKLQKNPYYRSLMNSSGPMKRSDRRDLVKFGASAAANREALEAAYIAALKDIQFRSVALIDLINAKMKVPKLEHVFLDEARMFQTATGSNRSRMTRIGREMSTMTTSLPLSLGSGIFVRADSERPDVLCAMIIGPEDTPYESGCFIFDILLPANYPQGPPKVLFKTTGFGTVRFNPNLYKCGKVCLSLLGTWQGPGWNPSSSTLLQVLVSIQSLILVEQPYFNEPGFESTLGTPQGKLMSDGYNEILRRETLQYGLLDQLKRPPYLFRDVLKIHFNLKKQAILDQCNRWEKESHEFHERNSQSSANMFPSVFGSVQQLRPAQMEHLARDVKSALEEFNNPSPVSTNSTVAVADDPQLPSAGLASNSSTSSSSSSSTTIDLT